MSPRPGYHMQRVFSGPFVMAEVRNWRPPRATCTRCGRDTAVRRNKVSGAYHLREHNNPATSRRCGGGQQFPISPDRLRQP
jgi:hypothetical protein